MLICFTAAGSNRSIGSSTLNRNNDRILAIARKELGVRELTGNNDGAQVERYLAYVGLKKGAAWCAAYVSWVYGQAGYIAPRTGWSPALFPASRQVASAVPGTVFGIWFPSLKRIAHCGFIERLQGDFVQTIEGNTNLNGSREGQGVYRRLRHKRTISKYSDWQ